MLLCLAICGAFYQVFINSLAQILPQLGGKKAGIAAFLFAASYLLLAAACAPGDLDEYLDGISTYVYANTSLDAGISWKEAKQLNELFSSNGRDQWYPMVEVLSIPKQYRREEILKFAMKVGRFVPHESKAILKKELIWKGPMAILAVPAYPIALYFVANHYQIAIVSSQLTPWAILPASIFTIVISTFWLIAYKGRSNNQQD